MPTALMTETELEAEVRRIEPPAEMADAISRWDVRIDEDWAGDPATHVTVVLKDASIQRAWPHRRAYEELLSRKLWDLFPDRFPYVWFVGETLSVDPEPKASRTRR